MTWPTIPALSTIISRLPLIFPEGVENRQYCIREATAKTIAVMFYCGAIYVKIEPKFCIADTKLTLENSYVNFK